MIFVLSRPKLPITDGTIHRCRLRRANISNTTSRWYGSKSKLSERIRQWMYSFCYGRVIYFKLL